MKISFASPLTADANAFLSEETGIEFAGQDTRAWFCATAWNDHGAVVGVLAAEPKTWFDWHWSCAVADPHVLSRRLLRTLFRTIFKAGARRITAMVDAHNEQAIRSAVRLGFVYEGYCRLGIEGSRDAYVFGMLEGDCRWLWPRARPISTVTRTDIAGEPHGFLA